MSIEPGEIQLLRNRLGRRNSTAGRRRADHDLERAHGSTRFQSLNTVLAMFGFFSLFVAAFNLIPAPPLDRSLAWGLVPALFKRFLRTRNAKREPDLRL
jgi:hypothetical protein